MFFKKNPDKSEQKLKKPQVIPAIVQNHLTAKLNLPEHIAPLLKAVVRPSAGLESTFEIRVYDDSEAQAKKVPVNDYNTLNEQSGLILYEGSFNEKTKQVELQEKKKIDWNTPLFTEAEILQKTEALNQPGSTVFFYAARGSAHGGPLGMGAAVIELNPQYPEKKQKKYNMYYADVIDNQPVPAGQKLFSSDKPKEIAHWVKEFHHKRVY